MIAVSFSLDAYHIMQLNMVLTWGKITYYQAVVYYIVSIKNPLISHLNVMFYKLFNNFDTSFIFVFCGEMMII